MEVKNGYKHTVIGMIPDDWDAKSFTDCADLKHGFQFRDKHFSKDGIKVTKIGNLIDGGGIDFTSVTYVPKEILNQFSNFTLQKGDVLMALTGATLGKVSTVDTHEITLQNYRVGNFFPKKNCTKEYIACLLQSVYIQKTIKKLVNEAAQPNLGKQDFDKFIVPIPPSIKEQTAIATALSDADALISSLEKLIAKKRNIKQGAMQQLLQPKEGWVTKKIEEIGLLTGAGVDKTINNNEEPVRLLNYMDVFRRDFIYSNELNHWVTAPSSKIAQCSILMGDVFFTPSSEMRYDIAISAVAKEDILNAVYSYHLYRFRLLEDWDINFRSYIFKSKDFLQQAEMLCEGSGKRYVISLSKFREMTICYPPDKSEQSRISTILYDMDLEIAALEANLEKYIKIKQGMMQQLLTGKIRLV